MSRSSISSPHRQPSCEVAQPKSTRLRRVRRTITSIFAPPYIQPLRLLAFQMSLCRMPRACRSVKIVAVCVCQSYGRFCGLTGSPIASNTMPRSLWQSSCGAHATSRSRRRKQASRSGCKSRSTHRPLALEKLRCSRPSGRQVPCATLLTWHRSANCTAVCGFTADVCGLLPPVDQPKPVAPPLKSKVVFREALLVKVWAPDGDRARPLL
eukprot:scaffold105806_cov60-Phaeocystis_antarctica.AAC.2